MLCKSEVRLGAILHGLCRSWHPSAGWLLTQVGSLAMAVNSKSSFLRGSERSLRLAVGLLTKTFLQNLDRLQDRPQFPHLWNRILQVATRYAPCHAPPMVYQSPLSSPCEGLRANCSR